MPETLGGHQTGSGPAFGEGALTFQQAIPPIYQRVYPQPGRVVPWLKRELNDFLTAWLRNLQQQGHRLVAEQI